MSPGGVWDWGPVQRGVRVLYREGVCTERLNALWVMVTHDPSLCERTGMTENITFPQLCWWAVKTIGSSFNGCNGHFLIVSTCWGLGISRWSMLKRVSLVKMAWSNILAIEECVCLSKLQNRHQEHNRMTQSNHQKDETTWGKWKQQITIDIKQQKRSK